MEQMTSDQPITGISQESWSSTEPNTPNPEPDFDYHFANLVPLNRLARFAVESTLSSTAGESFHERYIKTCRIDDQDVPCFALSLKQLPEFPQLGWRIGRGRARLNHRGVDLLLATSGDDVAGIHARFSFRKGAGGFFVTADNQKGKTVLMNGALIKNDHRTIPHQNMIAIGECLFRLDYLAFTPEEDELFQSELRAFMSAFCDDQNPFVVPTPRGNEASFGEWIVQWAMSRGGFGTVYMVVHSQDGRPAAAKHLLKTNRNCVDVENEIKMATVISKLSHPRVASPLEIIRQGVRTKTDLLLDESWGPSSSNDVTESFIIISPLSSTTLQFVCQSNILVVNQRDRTILFSHLLDAIAFLHGLGLSHRDIKPPNVLVHSLKPPHAVLTDFGCASDQGVMQYATVGTIPYLAPEQVEGRTHTCAVDLWAAALVGAQMMRAPLHSKRLLPGDLFDVYRRSLKFSNNVMATCCRSMLDVVPAKRMSAAAAYALLAEYLHVKEPRDDDPEENPESKRTRLDGKVLTQSVVSEIGQTTELLGSS